MICSVHYSLAVAALVCRYSEGKIDSLVQSGAAAEKWSEQYIPGGDPWAANAKAYTEFVQRAAKL